MQLIYVDYIICNKYTVKHTISVIITLHGIRSKRLKEAKIKPEAMIERKGGGSVTNGIDKELARILKALVGNPHITSKTPWSS